MGSGGLYGHVIRMGPSMLISEDETAEALRRLARALESVALTAASRAGGEGKGAEGGAGQRPPPPLLFRSSERAALGEGHVVLRQIQGHGV